MQQADSIQRVETARAAGAEHPDAQAEIGLRRRRRDSGAMLLAVLFMMAMMVIVAMAMAPAFVQQMKRDREEEMIHRGTEYARAIRKFYKKMGRYPANLDQLEDTNKMRFLRKRFADPLTKDGQWKLLRTTDIQVITGGAMMAAQNMQMGAPGVPLGTPGGQGANTAPSGAQLSPQQPGLNLGDQTASSVQTSGAASPFVTQSADAAGQSGSSAAQGSGQGNDSGSGQTTGAPGQTGSNNTIFGSTGVGGQTFGGGAIVGVASKDKDPTIRIYNKKKTYDEWMFIYSPVLDRVNVLLRGPYNGQLPVASQVRDTSRGP